MRFWFSRPRIFGVRPGVSLSAREAAVLAREMFNIAKWAGVALVLLYMYGASLAHAAEWRAVIECPDSIETVAVCQTRESCFALGHDRYAALSEENRRRCEVNVSRRRD